MLWNIIKCFQTTTESPPETGIQDVSSAEGNADSEGTFVEISTLPNRNKKLICNFNRNKTSPHIT